MFSLYLKTHNITGLKYLGYTKNNPYKYKGSGIYWKRHLKEHGNDVSTLILYQTDDIDELSIVGKEYSEKWNVAENEEFANLCEEDGNKLYGKANINFLGHRQSEETRKKISKNNKRVHLGKFGKDHPAYGHVVPDHIKHGNGINSMIEKVKEEGPWNKGSRGRFFSEETKLKMKKSANRTPKDVVQCPFCYVCGGKPAMMRFHFNNCKGKKAC